MKVVIIGGVAGGATAAARLRRLDEHMEIVMLERSGYISYANCGLPYYIGGVIEDKRRLSVQTPEGLRQRNRIEARVRNEAIAIDLARKAVRVRRLDDGSEYDEAYDKLLLAPGARPVRPPLPGIDSSRIFTLRTVEDTLAIREYITGHQPKAAVVVGGGFIGLEMAENLVHAGIQVSLVERLNQVMMPLDFDMACMLHRQLTAHGVALHLETSVSGFAPQGDQIATLLEGKDALPADMVILAIGVAPDTALAREAGLALGPRGAIIVDEHMRTSAADIYAVGDAVEVMHRITGKRTTLALAGPANRQGRIAADNIAGIPSRFGGVQGTSILKLFDMTVAATGLSEKAATAEELPVDSVYLYPASHATYYPGAVPMMMKVLFAPGDGKILGAQIIGGEGADKRIDVLATAIHAGMTAADLSALELAYAPPYSSARDPVNMAGLTIENVVQGQVRQFTWRDVAELRRCGEGMLVDVRTREEYDAGHIEGAVNLPLDSLRDALPTLDKAVPLYVYCRSGQRSYVACRILSQSGFAASHLSGGWLLYDAAMGCQRLYNT